MDTLWYRKETDYDGYPGDFGGTVVKKEDSIGRFSVVTKDTELFGMDVKLLPDDATNKQKKVWETDMSNLMDGVIELKSNR